MVRRWMPGAEGSATRRGVDHFLTGNSCSTGVRVCRAGCNAVWLSASLVRTSNDRWAGNTAAGSSCRPCRLAFVCCRNVSRWDTLKRSSCSCWIISSTTCPIWQHIVAANCTWRCCWLTYFRQLVKCVQRLIDQFNMILTYGYVVYLMLDKNLFVK